MRILRLRLFWLGLAIGIGTGHAADEPKIPAEVAAPEAKPGSILKLSDSRPSQVRVIIASDDRAHAIGFGEPLTEGKARHLHFIVGTGGVETAIAIPANFADFLEKVAKRSILWVDALPNGVLRARAFSQRESFVFDGGKWQAEPDSVCQQIAVVGDASLCAMLVRIEGGYGRILILRRGSQGVDRAWLVDPREPGREDYFYAERPGSFRQDWLLDIVGLGVDANDRLHLYFTYFAPTGGFGSRVGVRYASAELNPPAADRYAPGAFAIDPPLPSELPLYAMRSTAIHPAAMLQQSYKNVFWPAAFAFDRKEPSRASVLWVEQGFASRTLFHGIAIGGRIEVEKDLGDGVGGYALVATGRDRFHAIRHSRTAGTSFRSYANGRWSTPVALDPNKADAWSLPGADLVSDGRGRLLAVWGNNDGLYARWIDMAGE
ncbi:MAG: hypothetical protein NTY05_06675 [Rhodocyclales bacterium]|nr:hypothetical protein [Rhodocyclales bacterium]